MIRPQYRSGQYFRENTGNHLDIFVKKVFLWGLSKDWKTYGNYIFIPFKNYFYAYYNKRLKFVCVHGEKLLEPGKKII